MALTARKGVLDGEASPLTSNDELSSAQNTNKAAFSALSSNNHHKDDTNHKFSRGNMMSKSALISFVRRLRYQWMLLSTGSKIAVGIVGVFFLQHVVFGTIDLLYNLFGNPINFTLSGGQITSTFAVAINTYKRPDMLRQAVQHYADVCGQRAGISQVFVIWAEQGAVLPEPSSFFDASGIRNDKRLENRAEVFVLQKEKDSLNSRFEPIEQLTTPAVFMVDDDLRVSCSSLMHAFQAWNANPDAMVGFYPRLATPPKKDPTSATELIYHTWPVVFWQHSFNFVLTKAAFLHSKYMGLYSGSDYPQEILDYVDRHMNCEDIAMSLLVANYTRYKNNGQVTEPIFVEGSVSDKGLIGGISSGTGHMATRSGCLTDLTAILKESKGWNSPFNYQVPLGKFSWFQHAPGFSWQYRPSNIFEWFAFENTFT